MRIYVDREFPMFPLLSAFILIPVLHSFAINPNDLSAILSAGGQVGHFTFRAIDSNANRVGNPKHRMLVNNNNGVGQEIVRSLTCAWKKYPRVYFYGRLLTIVNEVDSAQKCASVCWQYQGGGGDNAGRKRCGSANFVASSQTCELMENALENGAPGAQQDAEMIDDANWVLPMKCETPCGQTPVQPADASEMTMTNSRLRIIHGRSTEPHSWPWIVSLQRAGKDGTYYHSCGGTLIRVSVGSNYEEYERDETDIIVTAAHCLVMIIQDGSAKIEVLIGADDRNDPNDGSERIASTDWALHPEYDNDRVRNDIALVKLERPVTFSPTKQPACLPTSPVEELKLEARGFAAGWGLTNNNGKSLANVLQQVPQEVADFKRCADKYWKKNKDKSGNPAPFEVVPGMMFCAGIDHSWGTCLGDSGGPLIFNSTRGFVLRGIVSVGPSADCVVKGFPEVYVNVSNYIEWIYRTAHELTSLR